MKYDIYFLDNTHSILKWKKIGIFGKSGPKNEGSMSFPKIIKASQNGLFPFWPEIYNQGLLFDYQNGSRILFEDWKRDSHGNMNREIDENFPMTFTNTMRRLRIFQI